MSPNIRIDGGGSLPALDAESIRRELCAPPVAFATEAKLTDALRALVEGLVPHEQSIELNTIVGFRCVTRENQIDIGGTLRTGNGDAPIGIVAYSLDPSVHDSYAHLVRIRRSRRDGPGMRPHLSRTLDFFRHLGLERIELEAGMSAGPVYWARAGFDFAAGQDLIVHIEDVFAAILGGYEATPRVATISDVLSFDVREERRSVHDAYWISRRRDPSWTQDEGYLRVLERRYGVDIRTPRPMGEAILYAISPWNGVLDLKDEQAVAAYRAFLA